VRPLRADLVLAFLAAAVLPARGDDPGSLVPASCAAALAAVPEVAARGGPYCAGDYADDLSALSPRAREFEQSQPQYTFCIRSTAVYECPYYAGDGTLKRTRKRVVAHGTGFAYRRDGQDTLVVTNEHVAEWPAVTDADHAFEDVPPGCRRVSDALKIVDNESDAYARDDVPLTRVGVDPQLDIAVLKAKAPLAVLPWKIGRSAALRERNAVDVRGFPLGVLRTTNVGKVTSAYEHDEDREWDHDDFVVDALLSPGNSGSPVFAVSCRTGEFELVGVYHAGYARGSAVNVVVGIDQVRNLLETLRRPARPRAEAAPVLDRAARLRALDALRAAPEAFFPFGATSAAVRARADGALLFEVMGRDFPVRSQPVLVLEDLPSSDPAAFGRPGRSWAGNGYGLRELDHGALDADGQATLAKLLDVLRKDGALAASYRATARRGVGTRERFDEVSRLERALRRLGGARQDLAQGALDLADRLCPPDIDATATLADVLALPIPAPFVGPWPAFQPLGGPPLAPLVAPLASPASPPGPVASPAGSPELPGVTAGSGGP
jgi:serine protease Do